MRRNAPVNPCLLKSTERSNHETKHPYALRSLDAHRCQGSGSSSCSNGHSICARQNVANVVAGALVVLMEKRKRGESPSDYCGELCAVIAHGYYGRANGVQMKLHNQTGERYVD